MTAPTDSAAGEAILEIAHNQASKTFGPRIEAAYALGSLAHGGFSALVSDVDFGLILSDPLTEEDAKLIQEVGASVRASEAPLSDRLSVFWGSPASLRNGGTPGRFPPLDRLDLIRYGRLLAGRDDLRSGLPVPSHQDLVLAAARMLVGLVERNNLIDSAANPAELLAKGPRTYTKSVLFPVRFLYTARTGEIGRNHDAAHHIVAHHPGSAADLAGAALRWRTEPATPHDAQVIVLFREGLVPLYLSCLEVHTDLARSWGEQALVDELAAAHDKLKAEQ